MLGVSVHLFSFIFFVVLKYCCLSVFGNMCAFPKTHSSLKLMKSMSVTVRFLKSLLNSLFSPQAK